ncbi:hypothetical protein PFISCL1PPCAC_3132 [Pristionchus fissidentatus]|uniref:DNA replication complex GINS protein SLD5 n=1 Tax=Pristionchus fissidentatus TaxID=1538716 RepID=A0AAV5V1Y6_9BILA|nr:hypothetical protein PFISCL1PPCAC_3132 [Pristionchus fissidentatus]
MSSAGDFLDGDDFFLELSSQGPQETSTLGTVDASEAVRQVEEGEAGEDEEFVTPAELLAEMKQAWMNECGSPACLLPHRFDVVDLLQEQLTEIERAIGEAANKDKPSISMHQMEIARVQYMMNDYMRRRLHKIEEHARLVLREHANREAIGQRPLLSEREVTFARGFASAETRLFQSAFLGKLPAALQKIPVPALNLAHTRCFAKVLKDDVEGVSVADLSDPTQEVLVDLQKDTIHCMSYAPLREHIENDKILLM